MKGRKEEGITLIALVITIIVLLILAGVTISLTFGENGILARAKEGKDKYAQAEQNEIDILDNLDNYMSTVLVSEEGYNEEAKVNEPKLAAGMIPVYYDEAAETWKVAPKDNAENKWYSYTSENKQWANIVTVSDENASLRTAAVDTEIPMKDITTFFVWIPRYAYSIVDGYKTSNTETPSETNAKEEKKIDITFIKGNTNVGIDGVQYARDYDETKISAGSKTPKIVHPAFTFGDEELTGIWVAKFEASGTTEDNKAVGNREGGTAEPTAPDESTYVKILPNVVSWRDITIGESQYQSMSMKDNKEAYGWNSIVDSHLIRNSEWGAVAYLCYSKYGSVPMINGSGSSNKWHDFYTGSGPSAKDSETSYEDWTAETNGYNATLGQLASTTGNVYGIYDLSGGADERVAAYCNSGNTILSTNGKSSSNPEIQYFTLVNGKATINPIYEKYWEAYEVSEEEKNNSIEVEGETLTQDELWSESKKDAEGEYKYEEKRHDLTEETWNNLEKVKGIGMNEVGESWSYRGLVNGTLIGWKTDPTSTNEESAIAWNGDWILVGSANRSFMYRGDGFFGESNAGVMRSDWDGGIAYCANGFRPVLAF